MATGGRWEAIGCAWHTSLYFGATKRRCVAQWRVQWNLWELCTVREEGDGGCCTLAMEVGERREEE